MKLIIAGSEGLLGKVIADYYEKTGTKVIRVDKKLGHDLTSEKQVKALVVANPDANGLVVLFALNPTPNDTAFSISNLPLASVRAYLRVNLEAVYALVREYAIVASPGSVVVLFSSTYGLVSPNPGIYPEGHIKHPAYSITKAGIVGMTKYFAVHLAPKIRVNCIAPGGVWNNQDSTFIRKYDKIVPIGRMMKKEEIIGPVKFLLSDDSSYMTGATLVYDGGYTAW